METTGVVLQWAQLLQLVSHAEGMPCFVAQMTKLHFLPTSKTVRFVHSFIRFFADLDNTHKFSVRRSRTKSTDFQQAHTKDSGSC